MPFSLRRAGLGAMSAAILSFAPSAPAVGGSAHYVDELLQSSAPGRLAYSTGQYSPNSLSVDALGTIGLDGSDQRTLTDPPGDGPAYGYDHSPQWSPDGAWLAYLQSRDRVEHVAVIPRDGGEPEVVDTDGYGPTWSPDGRQLAWVSRGDGSRSIGIANVVTTPTTIEITDRRQIELPSDIASFVGPPHFSPDGDTLLFGGGRHESGNFAALYSMPTSSGEPQQLSDGCVIESGHPAYSFSPDGSKVLFLASCSSSVHGTWEAFVVDRDGSSQHSISRQFYRSEAAAWSPSGAQIALTSGGTQGIGLVDLDGTLVGSFAEGSFRSLSGLVFAPDGSRVYTVASPADAGAWVPDLYAIPLDGTAPQQLTFDHEVFPHTVQAIDPGSVLRQFGDGPAATAATALTENVESVDTLVVAAADDFTAALAAAPLAARLGAAELVTGRSALNRHVLTTAERMGVTRVVLVGSVSPVVADQLRSAGFEVEHVARASSPYRMSAAIASMLPEQQAYVVPVAPGLSGQWRLPLATASVAALQERPLLLVRPTSLPEATSRAIRDQGITSVTLVGDGQTVHPRVVRALERLGIDVRRVRSSDPYEVSARFATLAARSGTGVERPVIASGASWASSITAPALAALTNQVSLLVDPDAIGHSRPTAQWLWQHRSTTRTMALMGGVDVMRPLVEAQLEQRS